MEDDDLHVDDLSTETQEKQEQQSLSEPTAATAAAVTDVDNVKEQTHVIDDDESVMDALKEPTADEDVSKGSNITLSVKHSKKTHTVSIGQLATLSELKTILMKLTGVPASMQKIMFRGVLKNDAATLDELNVKDGSKLMLIGSTLEQIMSVTSGDGSSGSSSEGVGTGYKDDHTPKKRFCDDVQLKKVLSKGKPSDAMVTMKNVKAPLPDTPLCGMLSSSGKPMRLTFKLNEGQLWIGTKTRTEKVPLDSIRSVVSEPIPDHEDYHVLAFQLGTTERSRVWVLWVPAMYVDAIRHAVL